MRGCTLRSEPVRRVLSRLAEEGISHDEAAKNAAAERRASTGVPRLSVIERAELHREAPIAITSEVAHLLYVLTLSRSSRHLVEFGGSLGYSTIHLAAAIRDGGNGSLISTEIHPGKAAALAANLREAGLDDLVEVRVGDALQTLRDLSTPVDLLFLDGWNELYLPLLTLMKPVLADGALIVADLSTEDPDLTGYLEHVRDPQHGWVSVTVPLDAGVEISTHTTRLKA